MGLTMVVGVLLDADDEDLEMVGADFAVVRELLDLAGAGPWAEPELTEVDVIEAEMWGYSGLHTVRRLAVHLATNGALPAPLDESQGTADDPLLTKAYAGPPAAPPGPFDHLIHHSGCEGYYVPVDFGEVIVDERLAGGHLGSSVHLLAETRRIAEALDLPETSTPTPTRSTRPAMPIRHRPRAGSATASSRTCACGSSTRRGVRSRPVRRSPSVRTPSSRSMKAAILLRRDAHSSVRNIASRPSRPSVQKRS